MGCLMYRSMLGWHSRFISCTSRSMLALLLASVFIFSAITCPVIRCCTCNVTRGEESEEESAGCTKAAATGHPSRDPG